MSAKLYKGVATFEFYFLSNNKPDVEAHARSIAEAQFMGCYGIKATTAVPITRLEELPEQERNDAPDGDVEWDPCGNHVYTIAEWFARQAEPPVRVQRQRTKGFNLQDASPNGKPVVYVGRPSKWGNANRVEDFGWDIQACLRKYREDIELLVACKELDLSELHGKNLACWCSLDEPCHADVLLEMVYEDSIASE